MTIRNLFLCAALAIVPACSSKSSDPMDKMISMMEDMAGAIDGAGEDCGKMAEGLEAVAKKYDLKEMKAAAEKMKGDKDKAKELMDKYGERMEKVMPKMMGMMKCANDPKMKELSEKFEGLM